MQHVSNVGKASNTMEKGDIDFKEIPDWWAICQNGQCPMAGKCLRHHVFLNMPVEINKWVCLMPHVLKNGECKYFRKTELVMMAKGFQKLFSQMESRDLRHAFRIHLTDYLGSKGTYYRYKDGERLLNTEQQAWIVQFLKKHGYEKDVIFDKYVETYDYK